MPVIFPVCNRMQILRNFKRHWFCAVLSFKSRLKRVKQTARKYVGLMIAFLSNSEEAHMRLGYDSELQPYLTDICCKKTVFHETEL